MKKILSIMIFLILINTYGCEDTPPNVYIPQPYVEAYLFVGQPIRRLILMESQPVQEVFEYDSALIRDAFVMISEDGGEDMILEFNESGDVEYLGYYYPDTTYKVKPNTKYFLTVVLSDSTEITASTTTPSEFEWQVPLKDYAQYPTDTLDLPVVDSLAISWTEAENTDNYLIRVRCLDTLEYGIYFDPPRPEELNRRIERPWGQGSRYYNDPSRWAGPLPNTNSEFVWNALKWYGKTELSVYAPDFNLLFWFLHMQRAGTYEEILASVDGAIGCFGSASVIRDTTFVLKNQL